MVHSLAKSQADYDWILDNLTLGEAIERLQFVQYDNWCNDSKNWEK